MRKHIILAVAITLLAACSRQDDRPVFIQHCLDTVKASNKVAENATFNDYVKLAAEPSKMTTCLNTALGSYDSSKQDAFLQIAHMMKSRIKYKLEAENRNDAKSLDMSVTDGEGDCEDLSIALANMLTDAGVENAIFRIPPTTDQDLGHVFNGVSLSQISVDDLVEVWPRMFHIEELGEGKFKRHENKARCRGKWYLIVDISIASDSTIIGWTDLGNSLPENQVKLDNGKIAKLIDNADCHVML